MAPDQIGTILGGKYRLTRVLGQGGMGVVYAAEHLVLGRPLAVKLLKAEFARDHVALARFHHEAINASRAGSPHIVEIIDLGTANGSPFIVMEYLDGDTLYAVMREDPATGTNDTVEFGRIADILCQVLSGLGAAHARGILHRDLKPGNILLTSFGDRTDFVKLVDFGVSKVLGGDRVAHMTRTGVLLGTPTYMAPEQVMGRKDIDHRADLWAAGIILFRALAGCRPHQGRSPSERLAAIATQDAPPLRQFRPDLDAGIEGIVRKALTRDPARRFASADEFREALTPYRGGRSSYYAMPATGSPAPTDARAPSGPATVPALRQSGIGPTASGIPTAGPPPPASLPPTVSVPTPAPAPFDGRLTPSPGRLTPAPGTRAASSSPPRAHGSVRPPKRSNMVPWISAISLTVIAVAAVVLVLVSRSRAGKTPPPASDAAPAGELTASVSPPPIDPPRPAKASGSPGDPSGRPEPGADFEKYVGIAAEANCENLKLSQGAASPSLEARRARLREIVARHGLTDEGFAALSARYGADAAATREITARTSVCFDQASLAALPTTDAGLGTRPPGMDDRTLYVTIRAEHTCWTMTHQSAPSVSSVELAGKLTEIALRNGIRTLEYSGLVRRFAGDAEAKAELDRRLEVCLAAIRSAGAADAATPDAATTDAEAIDARDSAGTTRTHDRQHATSDAGAATTTDAPKPPGTPNAPDGGSSGVIVTPVPGDAATVAQPASDQRDPFVLRADVSLGDPADASTNSPPPSPVESGPGEPPPSGPGPTIHTGFE